LPGQKNTRIRKNSSSFRIEAACTEELADETIDRMTSYFEPGFAFEGKPIAYFCGVARNVHLESLRQKRRFVQERSTLTNYA